MVEGVVARSRALSAIGLGHSILARSWVDIGVVPAVLVWISQSMGSVAMAHLSHLPKEDEASGACRPHVTLAGHLGGHPSGDPP